MNLLEVYGQSEELDTFVAQLQRRFNPYYVVTLKLLGDTSEKYFAYEDAAREYYEGLLWEATNDRSFYDGADISLKKVTLQPEEDELESELIFDDDNSDDNSDLEESLNVELGLPSKRRK